MPLLVSAHNFPGVVYVDYYNEIVDRTIHTSPLGLDVILDVILSYVQPSFCTHTFYIGTRHQSGVTVHAY